MYIAGNGFKHRVLSYLLSSIIFLLCAESTNSPTRSPTAVQNNEPQARLYGGIAGLSLCFTILSISFIYFYPKSAYHHVLHGVDEDQVHRHQLAYFLHTNHDKEIKMERAAHLAKATFEEDDQNVELRDYDPDRHRRVDLYQEEAPEPLCEALR